MVNKARLAGFAAAVVAGTAHAGFSFNAPGGQTLQVTGYLREHMAVNLQDQPEAQSNGQRQDGKGEISMLRSTFRLEAKADAKFAQFVGVYRFDREHETGYLDDINDTTTAGNAIHGPATPRHNWMDDIEGDQMREWYTSFRVGDRVRATLGKQQVVWGETDFFRAMDIIHGYDLRWRSFLELENEELRKPLILGNVTIDVPELAGSLQLIYRPGWDAGDDIGDSAPINGGRWAPVPWAGAGVTSSLIGPYNYHHNGADENDPNYGFRWSGTFKQVGYSFAYYRGLSTDGLVVRNPLVGGTTNFGQWEGGNYRLTELIFPKVETYGFTFNAYSGLLDSVLRGEVAFTPNKPYNTGTNTYVDLFSFLSGVSANSGGLAFFPGIPLLNDPHNPASGYRPGAGGYTSGGAPVGASLSVPGLADIVEKDTLKIMLGVDKNLNWTMNALGTSRPAFWTAQLFDTWVMNYDRKDDIVESFGFGAARREHQTILTNAFTFPYKYDTVTPGIALGVDLGSFDSFLIPSLDLQYGDHWRVRFEADLFFPTHTERTNLGMTGSDSNDARLLGTLSNRDQLVARITYQF
jgi:hypothetical protein